MMLFRHKRRGRVTEATVARIRAQHDLEDLRDETPKMQALAAALRKIREENHVAQDFLTTIRGTR